MEFMSAPWWSALLAIILIDLVLAGDNAIVIALACRHLPPHLRMKGIVGGALGAIVLRVILIAFAVTLLSVPYLKIIGGFLLLWIGMKLLLDEGIEIIRRRIEITTKSRLGIIPHQREHQLAVVARQ